MTNKINNKMQPLLFACSFVLSFFSFSRFERFPFTALASQQQQQTTTLKYSKSAKKENQINCN